MRIRSLSLPLVGLLALLAPISTQAQTRSAALVQPAYAFSEESNYIVPVSQTVVLAADQEESQVYVQSEHNTGNCTACGPQACESACAPTACDPCGVSACGLGMGCGTDACSSFDFGRPGLLSPCVKQFGQFYWDGWVSAGATLDPRWPDSKENYINGYRNRVNEFNMNQLYLTFGRAINKNACRFDVGGRVDLLYGTDYLYTSSLGLETYKYNNATASVMNPRETLLRWNSNNGNTRGGTASLYGLSMPQAYAEFYAPIGYGTSLKAGHFYSMMGYESAMAPENFFYSHTNTMMFGEPTSFTGMVLSQNLTQNLTGIVGLTQGWDVWENPNNKLSVIAGGKWSSYDQSSALSFTVHSGKSDVDGQNTRTNYSLVFSQQLTPRLKWVIQHDLGIDENARYDTIAYINGGAPSNIRDAKWYSISNYLFLALTDKLSFGARFEWFRDEGNARVLNLGPERNVIGTITSPTTLWNVQGANYYDLTLGFNWNPTQYITLRPEVRWDWSNVNPNLLSPPSGTHGLYNNYQSCNQFTIGLEGYVKF